MELFRLLIAPPPQLREVFARLRAGDAGAVALSAASSLGAAPLAAETVRARSSGVVAAVCAAAAEEAAPAAAKGGLAVVISTVRSPALPRSAPRPPAPPVHVLRPLRRHSPRHAIVKQIEG